MNRYARSTLAATAALAVTGLAGTATAAAPDACQGQGGGCTIVSRADVDGDGARDSVSMTAWGAKGDGSGRVTTRVATADGERMYVVTSVARTNVDLFRGAARIDGEDGYELLVVTDLGAHTARHQVLTYRDGELKSLQDPRKRYRWITDSSAWSGSGHQRTTTASGAYKFVSRQAIDADRDGDFTLTTASAGWSSSTKSFRRMGLITRYDVSPEVATRWTGWHVPYLTKGI